MHEYSNRVTNIEPSATVRISSISKKLKSQGRDIVDLSAGDPDFPTPDHIRKRAKTSLDEGQTHYTPANGIPELRSAIAQKLRNENKVSVSAEEIIVTPGAKQGLFEALFSLLTEGDEVVVFDPAWVSYESIVKMCGGSLSRIELDAENDFTLKDIDLAAAITDETRAVIVNTPSNPTGAVFSRDNLERIRDLAVDHDTWVIADEIYEKLTYGVDHVSLASLDGMADRTVTVNGFSKSHAMTGWRLGYYTAPDSLLTQTEKVQSHTVTCATSFAQYGAVAALNGPQEPVRKMQTIFKKRRDTAVDALSDIGVDVSYPDGAFYLFVPVDSQDDVTVCEELLKEEGVATTPGSAFGVSGYVRLSYANSQDRIVEGIERMAHRLT
jgi:aspartate aminotransferase